MKLEDAVLKTKQAWNTKDILEILGIELIENFDKDYYNQKIEKLPKWNYFISDLDWTFFRWTLQKEAVSLFIKFVISKWLYTLKADKYYDFLVDLEYFYELEKKAFNKEIVFSEYLNAGIYLLLKHKNLVDWDDYLAFIRYNFSTKEKIKPFRFSIEKMKEILSEDNIFLFVSWAPDFIFEIYLELLKIYISKNIWEEEAKKIYGFGTKIWKCGKYFCPLWASHNKTSFINLLREKWIFKKTIWWMWDTSADFWISKALDKWNDFWFINPEKKVIEKFDELYYKEINYKMIFERKDLVCEFEKNSIKIFN